MTNDNLLSTKEAAQLLGLAPGTLRNWRRRKRGPKYIKLSRSLVRYRRKHLEEFLSERVVDPPNRLRFAAVDRPPAMALAMRPGT